jgi:predicted ArsR family transcriptional regulator
MPKPSRDEALVAVASLRDPIRSRLYRYVGRALGPVGRDEAATAVGVSRATAAFHLDKLVTLGLLRAEYRRLSGRAGRGAGRPSKVYRRSRRQFSVSLPKREHELLARLVSGAMADAGVPWVDRTARDFGRALGARSKGRVRTSAGRRRLADCVEDVMEELGFEPVRSASGPVFARNCPFDPLSRQYPEVVCRTSLAIVEGIVDGVAADAFSVRREAEADRCCVVIDPVAAQDSAWGRI